MEKEGCYRYQDHICFHNFCRFHLLFAFRIRCNCLAVLNPHLVAMYSIVNSGLLSIVLANSSRKSVRYSSTVVPVFSLKTRLRFRGLMATSDARSSMVFSSDKCSIRWSWTMWMAGLMWLRESR